MLTYPKISIAKYGKNERLTVNRECTNTVVEVHMIGILQLMLQHVVILLQN